MSRGEHSAALRQHVACGLLVVVLLLMTSCSRPDRRSVSLDIGQDMLAKGLACQVGHTMPSIVPIWPPERAGDVVFMSTDGNVVVENGPALEQGRQLRITPVYRGVYGIRASLGKDGPIIAETCVRAFTVNWDELNSPNEVITDGQGMVAAVSVLLIEPAYDDLRVTMTMKDDRATFLGGATSYTVTTDGEPSTVGEAGFVRATNPTTGETYGKFIYTIVFREGQTSFSHTTDIVQVFMPPARK